MQTLIYLAIIFTFALIDAYFIEVRDFEPDKRITWSVRLLVTVIFALVVKDFNVMYAARYTFFLAFLFYALFDYTLNMLRGKPFFHKGQNWIDKLIPAGWPDLSFKIIGLLASYMVYQYDFFNCLRTGIFEPGFINNIKHCLPLMI